MWCLLNFDNALKTASNPNRELSKIAVAVAQDDNVLEAVKLAIEAKIAKFILIGNSAKIEEVSKSVGLCIQDCEIIHEADDATACMLAATMVGSGKAASIMKGLVDTSLVMKAVLNKETGMRTGRKLSHLAAFELPHYHKLLFVTDAAINIAPDFATKCEIIQNAVDAVRNLGIDLPKVALLAAKEKADEKMPKTMEWKQIIEEGKITNCIIDGPLALDNAVSLESAKIKGINSPVAGDADILVCPDIESGNILYKSLGFLANAKCGGVVVGAKRPVILTSRADTAEAKLLSIALGVLF
jgi:phosphate butyryltransferase